MIIDFHTHIVPPGVKDGQDTQATEDPLFQSLHSNPNSRIATAEDLIQSMDRDGIDMSVALNTGWRNPDLCRRTNDYIMEAVNKYPHRLIGFCAIQPNSRDVSKEVERCAKGGLRGIGEMMPHVQGFDLTDKELMEPIAEAAKKYNMIVLTHSTEPVGHAYPGKGNVLPEVVYSFITNFPCLRVVCAHWGGGLPFYALMPEVARALENVYFDTAASPFLYKHDVFPIVAELVGAEKILFGSDHPLITQRRIIKSLECVDMPKESKQDILGRNAHRLLEID